MIDKPLGAKVQNLWEIVALSHHFFALFKRVTFP
jgi:hypothetical protein